MKKLSVLLLAASTLFMGCMASKNHPPLQTVPFVDLDKYIGTWHEIASLPAWFEKKCVEGVTATYSKIKDKIAVENKCTLENGKEKISKGFAFVLDSQTNAKLGVSFVPFFKKWGLWKGDYQIIELASDYSYVMIGSQSRKFLWILARKNTLPENIYHKLIQDAQAAQFNTSKIIKR